MTITYKVEDPQDFDVVIQYSEQDKVYVGKSIKELQNTINGLMQYICDKNIIDKDDLQQYLCDYNDSVKIMDKLRK